MRLPLCLGLCLFALACSSPPKPQQNGSEPTKNPTAMTTTAQAPSGPAEPLPFEPDSTSDLLSATHLFVAEITSVKDSPWTVGADELEHRSLEITARLTDSYKGRLTQSKGQDFALRVEQEREGGMAVSDYHGLWSHVAPEPSPGVYYFVVAKAPGADAADAGSLMQQGPCQALLPTDRAKDVFLAQQGEATLKQATSAAPAHKEIEGAKALLTFTAAHAAEANEQLARYAWARIMPALMTGDSGVRTGTLALLSGPTTSDSLRLTLLSGVDRALPDLAAKDPDALIDAGRAMVAVLLTPKAKALHARIIGSSLSHLVFPDDGAADGVSHVKAERLAPDPADRARLADVLRASNHPSAAALLKWLSR